MDEKNLTSFTNFYFISLSNKKVKNIDLFYFMSNRFFLEFPLREKYFIHRNSFIEI